VIILLECFHLKLPHPTCTAPTVQEKDGWMGWITVD
jgi:hypothetical protein